MTASALREFQNYGQGAAATRRIVSQDPARIKLLKAKNAASRKWTAGFANNQMPLLGNPDNRDYVYWGVNWAPCLCKCSCWGLGWKARPCVCGMPQCPLQHGMHGILLGTVS